jgi:uncharacterized membrane protein HdeD (DUF308 family)
MVTMTVVEHPSWIRGVDIFIGLITVLIGAWILLSPDLVEATLVLTVAIGLFFIGLVRAGKGISLTGFSTRVRAMKAISGFGAILLSISAIVFSELAITVLITLLTFGIMLVGLSRIVVGYGEKSLPLWTRSAYTIGGGIVFFIGFFAAIFSGLGFFILRLMLSTVFFVLGIIRIAAASKGEPV